MIFICNTLPGLTIAHNLVDVVPVETYEMVCCLVTYLSNGEFPKHYTPKP